jgi:pantetheine-phosphate adenylyltransferase
MGTSIIRRAARLFDGLLVSVLGERRQGPVFTVPERRELIARCTRDIRGVAVHSFSGLLVDFMRRVDARRGRARHPRRLGL